MSIKKPYHRNYRPVIERPNSGYSSWAYIVDKNYAITPEHYTRAFLLIQNDLKKLFEYIEPADLNMQTYSYRIHELLMRTCMEIEANFKAILRENIYSPKTKKGKYREEDKWNIKDYKRVNKTHHLDSYRVEVPIWNGEKSFFNPFKEWKDKDSLSWYDAYNQSKHDRQNNFVLANFENLINAVAGLFVLLSSQFKCEDFSPGSQCLSLGDEYSYYSGTSGIGDFFRIVFPDNYNNDEKYDFNWSDLKEDDERFDKINYNEI